MSVSIKKGSDRTLPFSFEVTISFDDERIKDMNLAGNCRDLEDLLHKLNWVFDRPDDRPGGWHH
jgi:hypothetical protein